MSKQPKTPKKNLRKEILVWTFSCIMSELICKGIHYLAKKSVEYIKRKCKEAETMIDHEEDFADTNHES